ncbi:hypothetical protein RB623_13000 [Mesorhizobium sp. LHD-90]|uniref:hypothetical protein n=1 Tax=Mesorhizobium sp. LHD-90 TaxID=3071414 RepID=UPI0027E1B1D6|nr:hypothetical protein [Mesorhizobium sp. LHD-90]MDQ6434968.1 hypothetical protein [Mesorhizobium sp. LHD-90]
MQIDLLVFDGPPERLDAAGARQRETLRAGCIWPKSFGFRLGRITDTTFTETLDLGPNALWQSDPDLPGNALGFHIDVKPLPGSGCLQMSLLHGSEKEEVSGWLSTAGLQ